MKEIRHSVSSIHHLCNNARKVCKTSYGPVYRLPSGKLFTMNATVKVFLRKGTTCVGCGAKSTYYVEKPQPRLSEKLDQECVSLVLFNENRIKMTKDHIYPRSLGGTNSLSNMQPMCATCNVNKSDTVPEGLNTYALYSIKKMSISIQRRYRGTHYDGFAIPYCIQHFKHKLHKRDKREGGLVTLELIDALRYELWLKYRIESNADDGKIVFLKP